MSTSTQFSITNGQFEAMRAAICSVFDGVNIMGESVCGVTQHKQCIRAANAALRALRRIPT